MIFLVNKYAFPSPSENVSLSGSNFGSGFVHGRIDRGNRAILISESFDFDSVLNKNIDIIFADYSNVSEENIAMAKSHGIRVCLLLPTFSVNIKRFYAVSLFDRISGQPISPIVLSQIADGEYFVQFWEQTWRDIVIDFANKLASLKPDAILIRGIDHCVNSTAVDNAVELFDFVSQHIRKSKIPVFIETREFVDDTRLANSFDGVVFPDFFIESGVRRILSERMIDEIALNELLGKKEIYISDFTQSISQRSEYVARSRRRSFVPILRTEMEDGILDEELVSGHRVTPIETMSNGWRVMLEGLQPGDNRIQFLSGKSKVNAALVRMSPVSWPDILVLSGKYDLFSNKECQISLLDKMMKSISAESENLITLRLRAMGLRYLDLPEIIPEIRVLLMEPDRQLAQQWFDAPELRRILDRFTFPMKVRRIPDGLTFISPKSDRNFDIKYEDGFNHNLVLVHMYIGSSVVLLCVGDDIAISAFNFVLANIGMYADVLNEEAVSVITAYADSDSYTPDGSNVTVAPAIEKMPW